MLNSTMYRVSVRAVRTAAAVRRGPCVSFASTPFESTSSPASGNDDKEETTLKPKAKYVKVADIAKALAGEHDITNAQSTKIVKQVFDHIGAALAEKKNVQITGFGTFQSYESKPRKGRNPSTGESLMIPAKQRVKFAVLTHLKEWVETGTDPRAEKKTTTKKTSEKKKADDDEEDIE